jgi:hypothetical protein
MLRLSIYFQKGCLRMPRLVVVVQEGLDHLSESLERAGYKVVGLYDTTENIDAIVYSPTGTDTHSGNFDGSSRLSGSNGFVVMINAGENSEDEILAKLENIRY